MWIVVGYKVLKISAECRMISDSMKENASYLSVNVVQALTTSVGPISGRRAVIRRSA